MWALLKRNWLNVRIVVLIRGTVFRATVSVLKGSRERIALRERQLKLKPSVKTAAAGMARVLWPTEVMLANAMMAILVLIVAQERF